MSVEHVRSGVVLTYGRSAPLRRKVNLLIRDRAAFKVVPQPGDVWKLIVYSRPQRI